MKLTQLAICLLAAAPLVATAGNVFVTPAASYQEFGDILNRATSPQVSAGYKFANNFGVEATYNQGSADVVNSPGNRFAGGGGADFKQYRLDGLYFLPAIADKLTPYVAGGVGEFDIKTDNATLLDTDGKGTYLQPNAGLGAMLAINPNLKARLDARYLKWVMATGVGTANNTTEDYQVAAGLTYEFGKKAMQIAQEPMVVKPEVVVPAIDEPEMSVTPAMPADSDADGVYDARDNCPATPANFAVDRVGCPVELTEAVSIPLKVLFDTNQAAVKSEFGAEIAKVAEFMTVYPTATAVIEGHTDNRGPSMANKKLSQARADAIRNALVEGFNIDGARITAMGYGEDRPIADNATEAGLEQNRRVTARISGEKRVVKTR